jgi:hypothetical protein
MSLKHVAKGGMPQKNGAGFEAALCRRTAELTRRRIHSSIAGPVMMGNTLPPLASNDLFGRADAY